MSDKQKSGNGQDADASKLLQSALDINNLPSEFEDDDAIRDLEEIVKPKRKTGKGAHGEDVYEMCD